MQNLGNANFLPHNEVEHAVFAYAETVEAGLLMPPYKANVGTRSRMEGIVGERSHFFPHMLLDVRREPPELTECCLG